MLSFGEDTQSPQGAHPVYPCPFRVVLSVAPILSQQTGPPDVTVEKNVLLESSLQLTPANHVMLERANSECHTLLQDLRGKFNMKIAEKAKVLLAAARAIRSPVPSSRGNHESPLPSLVESVKGKLLVTYDSANYFLGI